MKLADFRQNIGNQLFTINEVYESFPDLTRRYLQLRLLRWIKAKYLERVKKGVYVFTTPQMYRGIMGAVLHYPNCYLSTEYVLWKSRIISHEFNANSYLTLTHVGKARIGSFASKYFDYQYSEIHPSLFFGFRKFYSDSTSIIDRQTYFQAYPEKALLDLIYLRHLNDAEVESLDFGPIERPKLNMKRFEEFLKKFPKFVQEAHIF